MLYNSVLETIGQTPVIQLKNPVEIDDYLKSNFAIYIKIETFVLHTQEDLLIADRKIFYAESGGID